MPKFKNTKGRKPNSSLTEEEQIEQALKDAKKLEFRYKFWLVTKTVMITLFVVAFGFEIYMHITLKNAHQSLLNDLKSGCYIVADESTVEQLKNQDFAMLDIIKIDQRENNNEFIRKSKN